MAPNVQEASNVVESEKKEIYYEGYFYDVTDWVKKHPGGKIIELYTKKGEDATLPVQQFHQRSTKKVMAIMKSLKKRPAKPEEFGLDPDTLNRHKAMTVDLQKLYKELEDEGLFNPSIFHVGYRLSELIFFLLMGLYLVSFQNLLLTAIGILSFALFQSRCGWLMHECGHNSLTGNPRIDKFLQALVLGFGNGMSSSWWSSQHNRHHAMPQRLKHDVDLDTLPLIAFNKKVVKKPIDGLGFFIQYQSILFFLTDTLLVATLWKFYLQPRYAIKKKSYLELTFMALHYLTVFYVGLINYGIAGWFGSVYSFGHFALSHTHLPVNEGSLHWLEYSLVHTVDIEPSWWCDWWMGYLNYQIEHHLFPTMPQFKNIHVKDRVRGLAKKYNIPYHCISYVDAVKKTINNLATVSKDLKLF